MMRTLRGGSRATAVTKLRGERRDSRLRDAGAGDGDGREAALDAGPALRARRPLLRVRGGRGRDICAALSASIDGVRAAEHVFGRLQRLSPALDPPCGMSSPERSPSGIEGRSRAPYRICRPRRRPARCRRQPPSRRLRSPRRGIAPGTSAPRRRGRDCRAMRAGRNSRRRGARKRACPSRPSGPCSIPPGISIC